MDKSADFEVHSKDELDFRSEGPSYRTHCGLCCVCHTVPVHSRTYYGHMFCTECFHKYIWSPAAQPKRECAGEVLKTLNSGKPATQNPEIK